MEKALFVTQKPEHYIPPKFLELLRVSSCQINTESKTGTNSVWVFTIQNQCGEPIGTIYESLEPLNLLASAESEDAQLQALRDKLALRQQHKPSPLPTIIDFYVGRKGNQAHAIVLLSYLGLSLAELAAKQADLPVPLPKLLQSSIEAMLELIRLKYPISYIGPEFIYVLNDRVQYLDLDEVLLNKSWPELPAEGWMNDTWCVSRRMLRPITAPSLYYKPQHLLKHYVYGWAASFLYLLRCESYSEEIQKPILAARSGTMKQLEFIIRLKTELLKTKEVSGDSQLALLISQCMISYPQLCPSFEDLQDCLTHPERCAEIALKEIIQNKCVNCGLQNPEKRASASCIGVMICSNCAKGACELCSEPHLFGSSHAKCLIIQIQGEPTQYLIDEYGVKIGRECTNNIRTVFLSDSEDSTRTP